MQGALTRFNLAWPLVAALLGGGLIASYYIGRLPSFLHALSGLGGWLSQGSQAGPPLDLQLSSGLKAIVSGLVTRTLS